MPTDFDPFRGHDDPDDTLVKAARDAAEAARVAVDAAAEAARVLAEHTTPAIELPNEGTVSDDGTGQGEADRQEAASTETVDSVSDGADSHDVGPAPSETDPAAEKGGVGEPPAATPKKPAKKTTPRKTTPRKHTPAKKTAATSPTGDTDAG